MTQDTPGPTPQVAGLRRTGVAACAAALACFAWGMAGSAEAAFLRFGFAEGPTTAEKRAAYPAEARREQGYAAALCQVDPAGVVSACKTIVEVPEGKGVGAALLSLAPKYRMEPIKGSCAKFRDVTILSLAWPMPDEGADWLRRPSEQAMRRVYPLEAQQRDQPGIAAANCVVGADGKVSECAAILESPAGFGFGQAAETFGPTTQMKPAMTNGKPVASFVTIPINFIPEHLRCARRGD